MEEDERGLIRLREIEVCIAASLVKLNLEYSIAKLWSLNTLVPY